MSINRRKTFRIVLVSILLFGIITIVNSCSQMSEEEKLNQQLINKVVDFLDVSEKVYNANVEEFEKEVDKIFVDVGYTSRNSDLAVFDLVNYLKQMTPEERKKAKEEGMEQESPPYSNITKEYQISKVYDYPDHNWKYVFDFQKIFRTIDNDIMEIIYVANRYRFIETEDGWKIRTIETKSFNYIEGKKQIPYGLTKDEFLKKFIYWHFNNKPVEYVKTLNYQYKYN